jgi:hypothetical protein
MANPTNSYWVSFFFWRIQDSKMKYLELLVGQPVSMGVEVGSLHTHTYICTASIPTALWAVLLLLLIILIHQYICLPNIFSYTSTMGHPHPHAVTRIRPPKSLGDSSLSLWRRRSTQKAPEG